jgi:hypothetical protein
MRARKAEYTKGVKREEIARVQRSMNPRVLDKL